MIDDSKNFDCGDIVSTVCSKTNLIKYGEVMDVMNRISPKRRKYFNVKWYPNGVTEKILAHKVYHQQPLFKCIIFLLCVII